MISNLFIDRPRLAIVIAIVMTLAGGLAMMRIPVAQLPDIVPPQVRVTGIYPGASAEVVEATVGQPIESKVIGVDKMLYMKSTSGNDGSYTLTVSFALGTNADINTVNVNNRVQTALAQLPPEVRALGLTVQKQSSSILQFISVYSPAQKHDTLFMTNYATINVLDELSRTPGVGSAQLFSRMNYSMRIWFDVERLSSLGLAPSDVIRAIQSQSVQAPVGRIGARPVPDDQRFQLNVQTQGRLTTAKEFGEILLRANADGSVLRISDVARVELGAQNEDAEARVNGQPGDRNRYFPVTGGQRAGDVHCDQQETRSAAAPIPGRLEDSRYVRLHGVRERHDQGSRSHARRSVRPCRDRRFHFSWQSSGNHRSHHRGPGQSRRHFCRDAGAGILR